MLASLPSGNVLTKSPAWRMFFVGLMVLALAIQGYTVQTHIHKQGFASASIAINVGGSSGHDKIPVNDDPANCPTCQQILHAGQFVAPAWLVPFLLVVAVSTIEITTAVLPHYDTVSHSWRSRGPPLH
jgi:hypothetical protein